MVFVQEIPYDGTIFPSINGPIYSSLEKQIINDVDLSSAEFNNKGIKPKSATNYTAYYIGGAIAFLFVILLIIISRK